MSDDALDALPKILFVSILGAVTIAVVLWHAFIQGYLQVILQQETAVERFIGLVSAVVLVGFGMAAVMFPLITAHKQRMNESFDGYEVSYSLRSFIPNKLIGTATVERVRHDDGGLLGMSSSPRINARRDRIHTQREEISCEHCHKTLHDVYSPGDKRETPAFTYIEKYRKYYLALPFYTTHIETDGYCPHHRPTELDPNEK